MIFFIGTKLTVACAKSLDAFKTALADQSSANKSGRLSQPLYKKRFPGTTTYSIQIKYV